MGKRKGQIAQMSRSSLVKDMQKKHGRRKVTTDTFLHTTELDDGTTYNRINFQSVTEQNNLEDFLTTAEMAGKDFTAERQNIQIIANPGEGIRMTEADLHNISQAQNANRALLQIPRRPKWDENTTKEMLELMERDSFTNWRRQLKQCLLEEHFGRGHLKLPELMVYHGCDCWHNRNDQVRNKQRNIRIKPHINLQSSSGQFFMRLEEKEHIQLTPYEKNLDFWRQLWRVIERSDVVLQIVDARNPLLFRCEDLEAYVREVDPMKTVMLLINKADYLTLQQRQLWVEYFNNERVQIVFFSAKVEKERQEGFPDATSESQFDEESIDDYGEDDDTDEEDEEEHSEEDVEGHLQTVISNDNTGDKDEFDNEKEDKNNKNQEVKNDDDSCCGSVNTQNSSVAPGHSSHQILVSKSEAAIRICNSPEIVTAEELLDIFRKLAHPSAQAKSVAVKTIGMVGYPNVGKSSTINVILQEKRLAVSATPGRTKHLQTLLVDRHLMLCDCPGLVFPSFVTTKAHLVINGILPIDELRDHISPVNLICERIPRNVLEATYSIMIPRPSLDDDQNRIPTAEELLNAYGAMRGFMNARGLPDISRASRYILKDFVKGKLLYCEPPPGVEGPEFQDKDRISVLQNLHPVSKVRPPQIESTIDKEFFAQKQSKIRYRGNGGLLEVVGASSLPPHTGASQSSVPGAQLMASTTSINSLSNKPWKKHNNRNKKEKLRRLHRDLDV